MKMTECCGFRWALGLSTAVVAAWLLAGCGQAKTEKRAASSTNRAVAQAQAPLALDDDPITLPSGGGMDDDNQLPLSPGDLAWRELQRAFQPPTYPPAWDTNEPTKEEIAAFEKKNAELAGMAADKAKDFYTRFPDHGKAAQARQQEYRLLSIAVQLGGTNRLAQLQTLEQTRLKDATVPEDERFELRVQQLQRAIDGRKDTNVLAALAEMEKGARALQKEFPQRPEVPAIMLSVAEGWLANNEVDKSRALAREVAKADTEAEVKEAAQRLVKKLDRVGQPLALKFKGLDGREVDLQQLKGKVVLVDFWATWCAPCMMELPEVKAAYDKLHERGFEILGLSFDQDKDKLDQVLAREKMTWPQHFDESGENKMGEEFGVTSIPAMWLVDKKGVLRDLNARDKLAEKVEKLLGEK